MTNEEINEAIAKACGWDGEYLPFAPNYCSDLNAMHEAEKVLKTDQLHFYAGLLVGDGSWVKAVTATASQRAEAFLKTLNLYTV